MTNQNLAEEKKFFDRVMRDDLAGELSYPEYLKIYRLAGLLEGKEKNRKLLEIGCGDGVHSCHLAKLGFQVTAIDVSEESIKKAQKRAKKIKAKVKFVLADFNQAKLPSGFFDIVVFINSLHHFYFSGLKEVVDKAKRILKKGGRMFIIEPNHLHSYTNLSYLIPRFFSQHLKFVKINYLEQVITTNERSLDPFCLLRLLGDGFELVKLEFFPYNSLLAEKSSAGLRILKIIRQIFDYFCWLLPYQFRYDRFSLKLIKK